MRFPALLTICGALLLVVAISLPTIASDNLNYQGRLTDASGTAVPDASYSLTFRVFNVLSGGSALWTETHPAVVTSGGLFTALLGSIAPLDLASLGTGNLYLEIQVGGSTPLSPRTLLSAVPKATSAGKLTGSVETGPSSLTLKRDDGEAGVLINKSLSKASIFMFAPQPEPPKEVLEIASLLNNGASIRMFAPQPEPPRVLMELNGDPVNGPSMDFFDDAGQVMGIEPMPFNGGFSIRLFAPQPEPPSALVDLGASYTPVGGQAKISGVANNSSSLAMSGSTIGDSTIQLATLTAKNGTGTLRLGTQADPDNSGTLIKAEASPTGSRLDLSGPPFIGGFTSSISLITNGTAAIGIGTPTPAQALHVVGSICYTGSIGACSDEKFKQNIEPVDHALDLVNDLEGVRYEWKRSEFPEYQFTEGTQLGFVAQEVREVVPEVVTTQLDGSLTVDYGRLTPLLLEAIKELKKQNEEMAKRIKALEQAKR